MNISIIFCSLQKRPHKLRRDNKEAFQCAIKYSGISKEEHIGRMLEPRATVT